MPGLRRGRYLARLAVSPADVASAQALRHLCFIDRAGLPARPGGLDSDSFDAVCAHLLIEDALTGTLAGCCRVLTLPDGRAIGDSYSAQSYDLGRLAGFAGPMLELGRFCVHPQASHADVLRVAWGALTRIVDGQGVQMLFGCSSFPGVDPAGHVAAFDLLARRHLGPDLWRPGVRAGEVVGLARPGAGASADANADANAGAGAEGTPGSGMASLPPLLRSYLAMGGWVSDHAVIDRVLNTLHVFTAIETAAIPPARARALRAVAG